jgi:hypothetical protein
MFSQGSDGAAPVRAGYHLPTSIKPAAIIRTPEWSELRGLGDWPPRKEGHNVKLTLVELIARAHEGPSEASQGGLGSNPRNVRLFNSKSSAGKALYAHSTWMFSQGRYGVAPETTCRAKRENWGLGEDPPGGTMTY